MMDLYCMKESCEITILYESDYTCLRSLDFCVLSIFLQIEEIHWNIGIVLL